MVSCPQCGTPVEWSPASRWRPFCSERCRLIDLGEWAAERYRIPAVDAPGEADTGAPDEPGEN
ncbi:MAG TPA: DNA gyrase inhibitor YacG [Casimicrobiaceae bacterium]|nr:DNA gyrase inhibitor YacG [Casimicrobiaceae bacterium]